MLNKPRMRKKALVSFQSKDSDEQEARKKLWDFNIWITDMKSIITELTNCLDSTICEWETFERRDIQYFYHHCESPPNSNGRDSSSEEINKTFDELRNFRKELGRVKNEISSDFLNAVIISLPFTSNNISISLCRWRLIKTAQLPLIS